jgi:non-homologous end joining protein Ku
MAGKKLAIELTVGGVPLPVNIELHARVKKTRKKSFRNLAPSGQPVQGKNFDPATGEEFTEPPQKGWELGKGQYAIIPPETIEAIGEKQKTTIAKAEAFPPLDTIALDLAIDRFAVRPDGAVPGSDQAVMIVWNGLRATKRAYVSQVSLGGTDDALLVLYADEVGFWAALLPFAHELYAVPTHSLDENEQAGALFEQMLEQEHGDKLGAFQHDAWSSKYAARREALIAQAIEGKTPITADAPEEPKQATPDLMALLTASVEAKKPKRKAAAKPKAKVTA